MNLRPLQLALALLALSTCGCRLVPNQAQIPPDPDPVHMQIDWRRDFRRAVADAKKLKKPILLVCASGHITGTC